MSNPYWPLFGLRLTAPGLELRLPSDHEVVELARLAAGGIHDPAFMPFAYAWTDLPPGELERGVVQYHWRARGDLRPDAWHLPFAVWADGRLAGCQEVHAQQFGTRRVVGTGSWLGQDFQRRGLGRAMREAVLHLAFEGLAAELAESDALADNEGSSRVSEVLGYGRCGTGTATPRGTPRPVTRFRLDRAAWAARPRSPVRIEGLAPCLPLLVAPADPSVAGCEEPTRLRLRPVSPSDAEAVLALWRLAFPGYQDPGTPHRDPRASLARKLAAGDGLFWVAEQGGRVIGTIMAGWDGHRGWLYSLAVAPDVRREGVARALVAHAERA
jgi:RimJ/RimL family protein N-acetyltransferase